MTTDIELIKLVAAHIDAEAQCLLECHNINPLKPDWENDEPVKKSYERMLELSDLLNAFAKRLPRWTEVSTKPDSDTTVQLFDKDASEPVWPGYFDGSRWLYIDGVIANPTHWADMPGGPTA